MGGPEAGQGGYRLPAVTCLDGADILWRERDGIRIVIFENPTPPSGAKLVKTVYRVEAQAKAR
jgi:hypothetical protein